MKVVIAGSGNTATVLGRKILSAGHTIIQVVGRNKERTASLASVLKATDIYNMLEINTNADIYIIAVNDSAISDIASQLQLNQQVVVHTAAAVSKEVLSTCSENYGVLYPLQTLRKELAFIPPLPVLIEGSNAQTTSVLSDFAAGWSETVEVANDDKRLKLHITAVFANNFINHLLAITNEYCNAEGLKFSILYPLIEETIRRLEDEIPATVQTGPAIRGDRETIEKHEQVLSNHPKIKKLYRILTDSIKDFYNKAG